ncbi:nitrile hydratase subunit alpha [Teichococcus vastitatis]|uniref:Nitrile hydratase subunit alpha n=1 Tax=Teichococcus vastitatis TaxID=2307076 RepID=A0ABS9W479_9PROT|nr:nitrile hydratase subunit alpha [Pseudoroseomonas vastitatis]MCI0753986.1 nitrile hydratase subunit alpha [Pseudoroseomonas vastitatis]
MKLTEMPTDRLLEGFQALLLRKGVVTGAALEQSDATMQAASPARGAAVVARAWTDAEFRARLLADGTAAVEEMGIFLTGAPPLGVVENDEAVHHLIVCTLCSCYPRALLGYPPHWYKSAAFRARAVRDPRGLLQQEWGTELPAGTRLRVVDSTADYRWMVLPRRPAGTEGWDAGRLAALVRGTDLIGVTIPAA